MNDARKLFRRSRTVVLTAALAALVPSVVGARDFIGGTDFQDEAMKATTSTEIDHSGYELLNLQPSIESTIWVPKAERGAMGPLRTEPVDPSVADAAAREVAAEQWLQEHLGPVGGRNTF